MSLPCDHGLGWLSPFDRPLPTDDDELAVVWNDAIPGPVLRLAVQLATSLGVELVDTDLRWLVYVDAKVGSILDRAFPAPPTAELLRAAFGPVVDEALAHLPKLRSALHPRLVARPERARAMLLPLWERHRVQLEQALAAGEFVREEYSCGSCHKPRSRWVLKRPPLPPVDDIDLT